MRNLMCAAALGLVFTAAAAPANASIIVSLVGNPVAATVGGQTGFDYTYSVTLSADEQLDPKVNPVFFTVYDFGQATITSRTGDLSLSSWAFMLNQNISTYASGESPNNNANIFDVRASYTGAQLLGSSLANTQGNLGTFTLFTTDKGPYALFNNDQDAQLEKYAPGSPTNDTQDSNLAAVAVPTLGRSIPEPASLAMLGAGLAGLAFTRRRNKAAV